MYKRLVGNKKNLQILILMLISLNLVAVFMILKALPAKYPKKSLTVLVNDFGFNPKSISVKYGQELTFVNTGNKPHWIASDHHPTHELYPEFDTRGPIDPGQKWKFKIEKLGKISYHDHLSPTHSGVITVEGRQNQVVNQKSEVVKKIDKISGSKGAIAAWVFYKKNYKNNSYGAHDVAHYIGKLIYQQAGIKGIESCDSSYGFGCYHGLIEELINEQGLLGLSELKKECNNFNLRSAQETCFHGLGHSLLPYYQYDIKKSLHYCDVYSDKGFEENCYGGVFMENSSTRAANGEKKPPLWPCTEVNKQYKLSCYQYQQDLLFVIFGRENFKGSFDACMNAGEKEYIISCVRGIGAYIAQVNMEKPEDVIRLCREAERDYQDSCITSAAEVWVFYKVPLSFAKDSLCSIVTIKNRQECIRRATLQKYIQEN